MTLNEIGRLLLLCFALLLAYSWSFKGTPQLDGVKDAWLFRISFALLIIRGMAWVAFDMLKLFPVN